MKKNMKNPHIFNYPTGWLAYEMKGNHPTNFEVIEPPYFEGEYQMFKDEEGNTWRRKFDHEHLNHGEWEKI